jgi:molecular chaperone GrpE
MAKKKERLEEDSALPEGEKTPSPGAASSSAPERNNPPAEGAAGQAAGGAGQQAPPESRIKALEAEASDLKDKLLRKQADFENFRKRMFRERDEAARYANAALLSDIIGVIDDFERAIRSAEESKDFALFLTGVSMIEKHLVEILETRWGLKRFASVGESFDPNKHEAVLRVEGPANAKPTVVEDYQKGYFLHERVLRPAKVKVMVPASAPGGDSPPGGNGADAPDPSSRTRPPEETGSPRQGDG